MGETLDYLENEAEGEELADFSDVDSLAEEFFNESEEDEDAS